MIFKAANHSRYLRSSPLACHSSDPSCFAFFVALVALVKSRRLYKNDLGNETFQDHGLSFQRHSPHKPVSLVSFYFPEPGCSKAG